MPRYAAHTDWVDLTVENFGLPASNVYVKFSDGLVAQRVVGIWAEGGYFRFLDGAEPEQAQLDIWVTQAKSMTWADWLDDHVSWGSTFGANWVAVDSEDSPEKVLADFAEEWIANNSPVSAKVLTPGEVLRGHTSEVDPPTAAAGFDSHAKRGPNDRLFLLQQDAEGHPVGVFSANEAYAFPGADFGTLQHGREIVESGPSDASWEDFVGLQASKSFDDVCRWVGYWHPAAPLKDVLLAAVEDSTPPHVHLINLPPDPTSVKKHWDDHVFYRFPDGAELLDLQSGERRFVSVSGVQIVDDRPQLSTWAQNFALTASIDEYRMKKNGWLLEHADKLYLLRPAKKPTAQLTRELEPSGTGLQTAAQIPPGDDWGLLIPVVYQRLAGPNPPYLVPRAPSSRNDDHHHALAYWGALHHLLLYRLGWSRPDLGLMWWYDSNKPVLDPTLKLVSDVWDADGLLDVYLYWLQSAKFSFLIGSGCEPSQHWERSDPSVPWQEWRRKVRLHYESEPAPWFDLDSGDPLHLHWHLNQSGQPDSDARLIVADEKRHRASFISSGLGTWYWDLTRAAQHLPLDASPGWRVDVYVQSVGYMGTFRRSSITNRWFTGTHSVHVAGGLDPENPPATTNLSHGTLSLRDRHRFLRKLAQSGSAEEWAALEKSWQDGDIVAALKGQRS